MARLRVGVAQQIVEQLGRLVEGDVAVADETGAIAAATGARFAHVPQRFALRVMKTGQLSEAIPEELDPGTPAGSWNERLFGLPLMADGQVIGAVLIWSERERIRAVARYLEALAEMLVRQVAIVEQIPQQRELKDKFLYDLLHADRIEDPSRLIGAAAVLDIDLAMPRAALVLALAGATAASGAAPAGDAPGPANTAEQKAQLMRAVTRAFDPPERAAAGYLGGGHVVVLLAVEPPNDEAQLGEAARHLVRVLAESAGGPVRLGIGRYWPELAGLIRSYREAALALDVGIRLGLVGPIYTLPDVSLGVFVGDADRVTKVALAERLVDGLGDDMVETIVALLDADLSVSRAAQRVYLHRHTLLYRLAKLKRATGRDLRRFWDALPLALALTLLRMSRADQQA